MIFDALQKKRSGKKELPQIIKLMADGFLGSQRENYKISLPVCYIEAFENISKHGNNQLLGVAIVRQLLAVYG